MTINLQSLVTATENADLAAKDAIIAAQAAEIAKRTATMDHAGIWLLYDWRPKAEAVGRSLDLTDFTERFRDDFSVDSIMDANGSPAGGKWYSPARANFDNSSAPFNRSQVTVANGQCRIRIERISPPSSTSAWGSWRAGHMQTMNQAGQGFAQPIVPGHPVYFEARIKLPVQDIPWGWQPNTGLPLNPQSPADTHGRRGSWPSFWLLSANEFPPYDTKHLIEMDCMENYAGDQNIHSTVHLKPRRVPQAGDPPSRQTNSELSPKSNFVHWDGNFHNYGALYEDDYLTIFFDDVSIARYEMCPHLQIPMYLNLSHAMFDAHLYAASSPMDMFIDQVRVLVK